jgi:phage protein U
MLVAFEDKPKRLARRKSSQAQVGGQDVLEVDGIARPDRVAVGGTEHLTRHRGQAGTGRPQSCEKST